MIRKSCLLLLLLCLPLSAQTERQEQLHKSVQRMVASFITTFPGYVVWPPEVFASHPTSIEFGLIGRDPLGSSGRRYLQGRGYLGKNFSLQILEPGEYSREELAGYQILYIASTNPKTVKKILKLVADEPVLTVSTLPGFIEAGGIIEFTISGKAVTFNVSTANARRAGLQVDSRLIKYGQIM